MRAAATKPCIALVIMQSWYRTESPTARHAGAHDTCQAKGLPEIKPAC